MLNSLMTEVPIIWESVLGLWTGFYIIGTSFMKELIIGTSFMKQLNIRDLLSYLRQILYSNDAIMLVFIRNCRITNLVHSVYFNLAI